MQLLGRSGRRDNRKKQDDHATTPQTRCLDYGTAHMLQMACILSYKTRCKTNEQENTHKKSYIWCSPHTPSMMHHTHHSISGNHSCLQFDKLASAGQYGHLNVLALCFASRMMDMRHNTCPHGSMVGGLSLVLCSRDTGHAKML